MVGAIPLAITSGLAFSAGIANLAGSVSDPATSALIANYPSSLGQTIGDLVGGSSGQTGGGLVEDEITTTVDVISENPLGATNDLLTLTQDLINSTNTPNPTSNPPPASTGECGH